MASARDLKEAPDVPRLPWEEFTRLWRSAKGWQQGEHVCLIGPTGRGKTTLAGLILEPRRFSVALDFKGDDPGLARWGWEVSTSWPVEGEARRLEGRVVDVKNRQGEPTGRRRRVIDPIRVRLSPPQRKVSDVPAAAGVFRECLEDVFERGGWTVYTDELLLAVDDYRLEDLIRKLMIAGRSRNISMVGATQRPSAIPRLVYDQATHLFIWPVRDFSGLERVEEITGFGRSVRPVLASMPKHEVLYVRPPDTILRTMAPKPTPQPPRPPVGGDLPTGRETPPRSGGRLRRAMWGPESEAGGR